MLKDFSIRNTFLFNYTVTVKTNITYIIVKRNGIITNDNIILFNRRILGLGLCKHSYDILLWISLNIGG